MRNRRRDFMTILAGGAARSPLLTGLIGHWKLDELTGNRLDSAGGRAMVPTGTVGYDVGKLGNCVTLPAGQLQTSADASILSVDWAAGFSVASWVYVPTAFASRFAMLSKRQDGGVNSDWYLGQFTSTVLRMYISDSASGDSIGLAVAGAVDTWHFVVGRYDPADKKAAISINGGAWAKGNALTNGPKNLYTAFGMSYLAGVGGTNNLDSVSLWARVLTDAEALELYNSGDGLEYPF